MYRGAFFVSYVNSKLKTLRFFLKSEIKKAAAEFRPSLFLELLASRKRKGEKEERKEAKEFDAFHVHCGIVNNLLLYTQS